MSSFFLFLHSLFVSWLVWAGGILRMIPFIEDMIEPWLRSKHPRIDAWFVERGATLKKNLKLVAVICLFIGCYRAWVFEHKNAEIAMYGKDGKSEAWAKYSECDKERAAKTMLSDSYSSEIQHQRGQLDNEQSTINSCVLALGKLAIPERPHIITRGFIFSAIKNNAEPEDRAAILVATTTRDYGSFKGYITCQTPFDVYEASLTQGFASVSIGTERNYQTKLPLSFGNSNWRVGDFVFVLLHGKSLDPQNCSITQQ